jgi:hypothetical protein
VAEVKDHLRAAKDIGHSTEYLCEAADNNVSKWQYLNIEMVSNGIVNDDR